MMTRLRNRTGDARKDEVRIRADQLNRSDNDDQHHGQHNRVFGNVLALIFRRQSAKQIFDSDKPFHDVEFAVI